MILIKDMGMPDKCVKCEFHDIEWEWNNEHHSKCKVNGKRIPAPSSNDYPIARPAWCPLVEVEPYGIDGLLYKEK